MGGRIRIVKGDITLLKVDAIVNAANSSLLGGSGVDGAIHRAAGPELVHACRIIGGCRTGQAVITEGYNLPAQFVIHTVGPVWRGGEKGEPQQLVSCYQNALAFAESRPIGQMAFPAISTGVYGYPMQQAAQLAINAVSSYLNCHDRPERVDLVCFDDHAYQVFSQALADADNP